MPGRHAQVPDRLHRRRVALIAAGAVLVVIAAGALTWTFTGSPTRATTVASAVDAPRGAAALGNGAAAGPDAAPPALAACVRSVDSGTRLVEAASASREHWGGHVQAQLDYDAGRISRQQMLDTFAATKADGPADLAAFDAARAEFDPISSACTGVQPAGLPGRWQPVATRCADRAAELAIAVPASEAVVSDWRAHVEMMQNKPHAEPEAYGQMWRDMVAAAPAHLDGYTAARDALARRPVCGVTTN